MNHDLRDLGVKTNLVYSHGPPAEGLVKQERPKAMVWCCVSWQAEVVASIRQSAAVRAHLKKPKTVPGRSNPSAHAVLERTKCTSLAPSPYLSRRNWYGLTPSFTFRPSAVLQPAPNSSTFSPQPRSTAAASFCARRFMAYLGGLIPWT